MSTDSVQSLRRAIDLLEALESAQRPLSLHELSTRVSNIHIQRALRRGFYQDFRSGKAIDKASQPSSSNEPVEMEQEQSLVVELRRFVNVPSQSRSLIAQIRCGDQVYRCGEMGASSSCSTLASAQQAKIFKEVKIGCKMRMNDAGQILVTSVEKGSEADRLGVVVGMSLWGVNDGSVEGLLEVNRKLKSMPRPLKLVFLAPYRRECFVFFLTLSSHETLFQCRVEGPRSAAARCYDRAFGGESGASRRRSAALFARFEDPPIR